MIEHVIEYLEALEELSEQFGLRPALDPRGDSLMLVDTTSPNERPIVWLNSTRLVYKEGASDVDMHALRELVDGPSDEEEKESTDIDE